ncbi:MAG: CmcI family methyltransferase, partial [Minisyncoccia bacterium]
MIEGGFAYGYLFMSQHRDAPKIFKKLLSEVQPARILEIGTFHGGLTLCLRDIMDELGLQHNPILTYDINNQEFLKPLVVNRNVDVRTKNLFDYSQNSFISDEAQQELGSFIQQPGVTLVLCDGGCKKCEYNIIAPLLKIGDIIMAHDYAPNQEYFEKHIQNKIWNWMEIQDSDINKCVMDNNLMSFNQDIAQQMAWCCKV